MNTNTYTVQIDPKLNHQVRAWYYFGREEMTNFENVLETMSLSQLFAMWLSAEDTADNQNAADFARISINRVGMHFHGNNWLMLAMHAANGLNEYQANRLGVVYTTQTAR